MIRTHILVGKQLVDNGKKGSVRQTGARCKAVGHIAGPKVVKEKLGLIPTSRHGQVSWEVVARPEPCYLAEQWQATVTTVR